MKKDICLCIIKEKGINIRVHSIGIKNKEGKYYSEEQDVYFDLYKTTNLFDYIELTWAEFRILISSEKVEEYGKQQYNQAIKDATLSAEVFAHFGGYATVDANSILKLLKP